VQLSALKQVERKLAALLFDALEMPGYPAGRTLKESLPLGVRIVHHKFMAASWAIYHGSRSPRCITFLKYSLS
jgi:hypothetical protein